MALVCTGLGFRYEGASEPVFRDVSLAVQPGELVGIAGCSGSGKTTLLRCLAGELAPVEGEVRADDMLLGCASASSVDVAATRRQATRREAAMRVGLVSQMPERQLFGQTVWEDVAFGPRNAGLAEPEVSRRVSEALDAAGFDEVRAQKVSPFQLSGGEQRRVAIAGMLALHTPYLLLDEPTAGLDPSNRTALMEVLSTLAQAGTGVVMVSHDMDVLALHADHLVLIGKGALLCEGPPSQVFSQVNVVDRSGLELPVAARMAQRLRARGLAVPEEVVTPHELVATLGSRSAQVAETGVQAAADAGIAGTGIAGMRAVDRGTDGAGADGTGANDTGTAPSERGQA